MMNRNNKKSRYSTLLSNNKIVFLFSLVLAVVFWCAISMTETTEVERVLQNVNVKINMENSMPKNNDLEIFGQKEFTVNVTVKGLRYIINDDSFNNDDIEITASCANVMDAGTYDLTLNGSIPGIANGSVEIVNISSKSIRVTFDKREVKTFPLVAEVVEGDGYSCSENITRDPAELELTNITLSGPSKEISKIASVKAVAEIDEALESSLVLNAEIVPVNSSGVAIDMTNIELTGEDPIKIVVPALRTDVLISKIDFVNIPSGLDLDAIAYSVSPESISVSTRLPVGADKVEVEEAVVVGAIDFNKINNISDNVIVVEDKNTDIAITEEIVVRIDMSGMYKRWLRVPLDYTSLPAGVSFKNSEILSVQLIGPEASIKDINDSKPLADSEVYAVPVFENGNDYKTGDKIPVVFKYRTINDSWVYGEYFAELVVAE